MAKKEIVPELSANEFLKFIDKNKGLIVVDFYAEWCMPCLMMAPVIETLAENNKNVKFAKVNIDDARELSQLYGISSIPCIILFFDGKEVDRLVGSIPEDTIQEKIKIYKN